jgi:hypothetical protein
MLGPAPQEPTDYDAFAHEPPFRPRRNRSRMWTTIALLAGALMLAAAIAVQAFGLERIAPAVSLGGRGASPLKLEYSAENQTLASGNAMLQINGRIFNPTGSVQRVPQIQGQLLDGSQRIVYRFPIAPPVSELQPGQSATINAAEIGVPAEAATLRLRFASGT